MTVIYEIYAKMEMVYIFAERGNTWLDYDDYDKIIVSVKPIHKIESEVVDKVIGEIWSGFSDEIDTEGEWIKRIEGLRAKIFDIGAKAIKADCMMYKKMSVCIVPAGYVPMVVSGKYVIFPDPRNIRELRSDYSGKQLVWFGSRGLLETFKRLVADILSNGW